MRDLYALQEREVKIFKGLSSSVLWKKNKKAGLTFQLPKKASEEWSYHEW